MRNRWSLVSSRAALAVVGAVVIGGISAAAATGPMLLRGTARAD